MAKDPQKVDVVEIYSAREAMGEVVVRVDGNQHLAATGEEEGPSPKITIKAKKRGLPSRTILMTGTKICQIHGVKNIHSSDDNSVKFSSKCDQSVVRDAMETHVRFMSQVTGREVRVQDYPRRN